LFKNVEPVLLIEVCNSPESSPDILTQKSHGNASAELNAVRLRIFYVLPSAMDFSTRFIELSLFTNNIEIWRLHSRQGFSPPQTIFQQVISLANYKEKV
jgi:hypothetical protein